MKKYIVIKQYKDGIACSSVDFTSDIREDAFTYADIMERNCADDNYHYIAAELC